MSPDRIALDRAPPDVAQVFGDTDEDLDGVPRRTSSGVFTVAVLLVILALAGIGTVVLVPDLPDRVMALLQDDPEPATPEPEVPLAQSAPVWIDPTGERYEVGFRGPCPASTGPAR